MQTVISAAKLFLLISMGLVYLLGLGWLVVGPLLQGSLRTRNKDFSLLQEIPLALISGLIINYGIVLCFQSLKVSLTIGCIIAIFGIYCFVVSMFSKSYTALAGISTIWLGIVFICLLFLSPILAQPLKEWDARSIWFFHAKMIYEAGTFGQAAGWLHPSIVFSHTDYPNLVSSLAAQAAYIVGFWNEYIPKISLFFMLVPAIIWLFTFARQSFSFAILLLLIPFSISSQLWNGLMDGYLALYFSIAMLLLGRFIAKSQFVDLISSRGCLIMLLYIKNEGLLAALIGYCLIISIFLFIRKDPFTRTKTGMAGNTLLAVGLVLLPFVLWSLYKRYWNISNDLEIGAAQSLVYAFSRLQDGSYKLILQSLYKQIESSLLLLGVLYTAAIARSKSLAVKESFPALIAAGVYFLGIMSIYFLTPYPLVWHLSTSVNRTMLSVNTCIFIGCYYILNELETNYKASQQQ